MRIDELETPALLIEQPVLNANIERIAEYCRARQVNLRVDVGCHKIPMIAYKQLAAGACGIACRTLSEVQGFTDAGFDDILVPRSALNVVELDSLLNLVTHLEIHLTADSLAAVNEISRFSDPLNLKVPILIEIVNSGNRNRPSTSLDPVEIAQRIMHLPSLEFAGVVIKLAPSMVSAYVNELIRRFEDSGISIPVLSLTDNEPVFQINEVPQITELCVGTYALFDYSHVCRSECTLADCALAVLTTVIDTPSKNLAIVDAGLQTFTKTPTAHTNQLPALSYPPIGVSAEKVFGVTKCNPNALCYFAEDYGHLCMADNQFKVGDKVRIIPAHSEATIGAFDTFAFVQDNRVLEVLPIL